MYQNTKKYTAVSQNLGEFIEILTHACVGFWYVCHQFNGIPRLDQNVK